MVSLLNGVENWDIPPMAPGVFCTSAIKAVISIPEINTTIKSSRLAEINQITNWVIPARDVPIILPNINWNGFTEDMITSMILLVFSLNNTSHNKGSIYDDEHHDGISKTTANERLDLGNSLHTFLTFKCGQI